MCLENWESLLYQSEMCLVLRSRWNLPKRSLMCHHLGPDLLKIFLMFSRSRCDAFWRVCIYQTDKLESWFVGHFSEKMKKWKNDSFLLIIGEFDTYRVCIGTYCLQETVIIIALENLTLTDALLLFYYSSSTQLLCDQTICQTYNGDTTTLNSGTSSLEYCVTNWKNSISEYVKLS